MQLTFARLTDGFISNPDNSIVNRFAMKVVKILQPSCLAKTTTSNFVVQMKVPTSLDAQFCFELN